MNEIGEPPSSWPGRILFALNLLLAAALIALVVLTPWIWASDAKPVGWEKALALFANDPAVRRTAIASAIGLTVTAFVFFRSTGSKRTDSPSSSRLPPRPGNMVGA